MERPETKEANQYLWLCNYAEPFACDMGNAGIKWQRDALCQLQQTDFTSYCKDLKENHPTVLPFFKVEEKERQYRVWQRDPLAILMDYKNKLEQKLHYLHYNPLA